MPQSMALSHGGAVRTLAVDAQGTLWKIDDHDEPDTPLVSFVPAPDSGQVILLGHADCDPGETVLTAIGEARARTLPDALVDLPLDRIFLSGFRRNADTAAPLASARGLVLRMRTADAALATAVEGGSAISTGNAGKLSHPWDACRLPGEPPVNYGEIATLTAEGGCWRVGRRSFAPRSAGALRAAPSQGRRHGPASRTPRGRAILERGSRRVQERRKRSGCQSFLSCNCKTDLISAGPVVPRRRPRTTPSSTRLKALPLAPTLLSSTAICAFARDNGEFAKIGETTALVAEASTAGDGFEIADGESADTDFPYISAMKALATVGDVDKDTGMARTGRPRGNAAWLLDKDSVCVARQSESRATMSAETCPWKVASGVTFGGSHIHTLDYSRESLADVLDNDMAASERLEGSGHLFDTVYNVSGDEVLPKSEGGVWGNQVRPDADHLRDFIADAPGA